MAYTNKEDQRAYGRQHYLDNKEVYQERAKASNKIQLEDRRARVLAYLLEHPCVDCGEADPVVLEFDHLDPATKVAGIGKMIQSRVKWETMLEEIAKCEVRCANCHRRRTARQFGWSKLSLDT